MEDEDEESYQFPAVARPRKLLEARNGSLEDDDGRLMDDEDEEGR